MKKKSVVVIAIVIGILVAVVAGIIIFNNSEKEIGKTENAKVETPLVEEEKKDEKTEDKVVEDDSKTEEMPQVMSDDVSTQYISDTKPEEKPVEENVAEVPKSTKVEAIPGQHRDPNKIVVVIDPGHQLRGDSTQEPNGPGSTTMKARVTSGTSGVATGVAEYILNLDISLKLKTELENRGYTVHMTRSTHDVNISNKERAEYATSVNADIAVRIHANGGAASVRGAETYGPSASNPYVSHLSNASMSLSKCIVDAYCAATGFKNRGARTSDIMTGINWSSVPVTIVELGYMSNPEEDRAMQDANMQNNMVQGIANGIDTYFGL